jgi:O-antigen ligase
VARPRRAAPIQLSVVGTIGNMSVGAQREGVFTRIAFAGALVYIATIPLNSLARLGPLGSLAKGGAAVLVGAALFAFLGGGLRVRRTDGSLLVFGAFVAWSVLSYFWSGDKDLTLSRALTDVQLLLATLVLWQHLGTHARVLAAVRTFVVGTFFGSAYALVVRQPHTHGVARFSVGDPNSFGIEVVFALLAAYWLMGQTESRRWKQCYGVFFVVGTVEVFSTVSRTALVTLGLALLFVVADRRFLRPRYIAAALAVGSVAGYVVLQVVTSRQLERLGTVGEAATSGANGRTTQWRLAIDVLVSHPIEGLGAAVFRNYSAAQIGLSRVAHSSWLGVAADLGAVGLVLFVAMFAMAVRGFRHLPPRTRRLWFGLCAVWLVGASTLTWENHKFSYFVLALFAAQSALATARTPVAPLPAVAAAHPS